MFGYVRPRADALCPEDRETYHAAYCGLCRALKKRYGFLARFLVNYDMTFLYLLRTSVDRPAAQRNCFCPARIVRKKRCVCDEDGYAVVADCTLILCYQKLLDNIADCSLLRSMPYRLLRRIFARRYLRASRALPKFSTAGERQMEALRALEAQNSPSIDATADTFARLITGCAEDVDKPEYRRPMQAVLYHVGRFLYLADALDDLPKDCEEGSYNPLRFRFTPRDGKIPAEDLTYLQELMDSSVNLAGAALELLPMRAHQTILKNIIYLGLPAVFTAVRNGTFHSRSKVTNGKEKPG